MLRFVTTTRSENQCEKWHFWSKMGSGFWEPGWTPGGGGDSAYERGGDFRRKFWIKPRRPIWAWPKLLLTPKKRPCWNTDNTHIHRLLTYFYIFSRATLNETFTAKYDGVLLRTPQLRPKSEIYTPKRDDEHPHPFYMRSPSPGAGQPHQQFPGVPLPTPESQDVSCQHACIICLI